MNIAAAVIIAFMIIIAFLIGAYSMYRISEHYNRILRDQIRSGKDPFFSVEPEPERRPDRKRRPKPVPEQKTEESV